MSLLNVKRTATLRQHPEWFKAPPAVYFNAGSLRDACLDLFKKDASGKRLGRCMIVTDRFISDMGQLEPFKRLLEQVRRNAVFFLGGGVGDVAPARPDSFRHRGLLPPVLSNVASFVVAAWPKRPIRRLIGADW